MLKCLKCKERKKLLKNPIILATISPFCMCRSGTLESVMVPMVWNPACYKVIRAWQPCSTTVQIKHLNTWPPAWTGLSGRVSFAKLQSPQGCRSRPSEWLAPDKRWPKPPSDTKDEKLSDKIRNLLRRFSLIAHAVIWWEWLRGDSVRWLFQLPCTSAVSISSLHAWSGLL